MTNKIIEKSIVLSIPLMIILLGFPHVSETIYSPALPQITQDLNTTSRLTELTLSIYFIGFALGVAIWGMYCDLMGRRPALIGGVLVYTIACFLLWRAESIQELLTLRFIQGLGASAGSVVTQTMIRDIYEGTKRHQMFAIVGGALSFSPAIGPWLGGFLSTYFGWHFNFFVLTIMGCLIIAYCYAFLNESRSINSKNSLVKHTSKNVFKMICDKNLLKHVLFISLANGIVFGFYAEAPFLFINSIGFTPFQYGLIGIVLCISGVLAACITHRLSEKMPPQRIIAIGSSIALIGSLILVSSAMFDLYRLNVSFFQLIYIISAIAIVFLGVNLLISNSLSVALNDYSGMIGTAGAVFGLMYYIGIAFFTSLISLFHNGTAFPMPILFTSYALCACLISVTLLKKQSSFQEVEKI